MDCPILVWMLASNRALSQEVSLVLDNSYDILSTTSVACRNMRNAGRYYDYACLMQQSLCIRTPGHETTCQSKESHPCHRLPQNEHVRDKPIWDEVVAQQFDRLLGGEHAAFIDDEASQDTASEVERLWQLEWETVDRTGAQRLSVSGTLPF